jgi:NAD(P)-dependent dehydrogenase (short-subunit alcohol dehydrogenase family)
MAQPPTRKVVVIIGPGGMGLPLALRLSAGAHLLLADNSPTTLSSALNTLQTAGHSASTHATDITSYTSVLALAHAASDLGPISAIIHAAGVAPGPGGASAKQIFEIDLRGTANIIQAFHEVASVGTSLVCIASMAGNMVTISSELETHLATAPLDQLLAHAEMDLENEDPGMAYIIAKRGNQLRVQAAARGWGLKGARVNSVSPGVIMTGMVKQLLDGEGGDIMREMIGASAVRRIGTAGDVANAGAFLVKPESDFVTGVDLLVDGGTVAGRRWGAGCC